MRFVIDETSWRFDGLEQDQCNESLEVILDMLDNARIQGHLACYSDELFNIHVYQNKCFYDLYDPGAPLNIPRDIQDRIASIFFGLPKWQDFSDKWPASFELKINGGPKEVATSIAWAHEQACLYPPQYIACLCIPGMRQAGYFEVTASARTASLWFVSDGQSYCNYFRWLIINTTSKPAEMEELSLSAFPAIVFVDGAFKGIKSMSKQYRALVEKLVHHLGIMSDHGSQIFMGPWAQAASQFGAFGVEVSDENGNTKSNNIARKERTVKFEGAEVVCWWHSKLEPHVDRIHFIPDKTPRGYRLIVGIFCRHLQS